MASQHDIKMTFASGGRTSVARMAGAVINDSDLARVKGHAQLIFDLLPD